MCCFSRIITCKLPSYELSRKVKTEDNHFGGTTKRKGDRGVFRKWSVGLLNRIVTVFTVIVPNARTETLPPIIEEKVTPESIVYHRLVKSLQCSQVFADRTNHINGIENFWNQAKRHLRKFNGINKVCSQWFLNECEWPFNGGNHRIALQTV